MSDQAIGSTRYSRIAIWLHWLIATAILINLFLGFTMDSLFKQSAGFVFFIHASLGFSILGLVILRILWRIANPPPELQPQISGSERLLARFGHFALYAAMLLLPLSGWAIISGNPPANSPGAEAVKTLGIDAHPSSGFPVWGMVTVPAIKPINELGRTAEGVRPQSKLHDSFEALHELAAITLIGLFVLHLLGALKHQFIDRLNILARMGINRKRK